MVTPLNSVPGLLIVASLWERPQAFVAAAPSVQAADEVCCPPEPPSCIVTRISELMCIHSPFPGGRTEPETCSPRTPTTTPPPRTLYLCLSFLSPSHQDFTGRVTLLFRPVSLFLIREQQERKTWNRTVQEKEKICSGLLTRWVFSLLH